MITCLVSVGSCWAHLALFFEGFGVVGHHSGHLGAQGGPGFPFVCEPAPKGSPLFESCLALLQPRTLRGATLDVKKWVLKASGFQASFFDDFGSDLEVPGTATTWVSCDCVV